MRMSVIKLSNFCFVAWCLLTILWALLNALDADGSGGSCILFVRRYARILQKVNSNSCLEFKEREVFE